MARDIPGLSSFTNTEEYLPVRWEAFIDICSIDMLRMMLPKLDGQDKIRAVYRIGDDNLIHSSIDKPDYELASKYGYLPHIRVPSPMSSSVIIRQGIRGLPIETLMTITNRDNYDIFIRYAIEMDRLDYVRFITGRYNVGHLNKIVKQWKIPISVYLWARDEGYLSSIKMSEVEESMGIILRDNLEEYSGLILPGIKGRILRYNISTISDKNKLDNLHLTSEDIYYAMEHRRDMRHYYLVRAMREGYFEILDEYMEDEELKAVTLDAKSTTDSTVRYLTYRYA